VGQVSGGHPAPPDPAARIDPAGYLEVLRTQGALVAATAQEPYLDRTVPHCPGWVVQRADVQQAAEPTGQAGAGLDPVLAADGVDELVRGFIQRFHGRLRCPHPVTLALHATDTDDHWWVRIGPGRPLSGLGRSDGADTEVHARAAELFLLLWNRRTSGGLDVRGEPAGLQIWQRDARR
jgi:MDMPI C-terminal domain